MLNFFKRLFGGTATARNTIEAEPQHTPSSRQSYTTERRRPESRPTAARGYDDSSRRRNDDGAYPTFDTSSPLHPIWQTHTHSDPTPSHSNDHCNTSGGGSSSDYGSSSSSYDSGSSSSDGGGGGGGCDVSADPRLEMRPRRALAL